MKLAERPTSRIVLVNERDELLLICYRDSSSTAVSGAQLWVTPGGGLEASESYEDAARRELLEESSARLASRFGRDVRSWTACCSSSSIFWCAALALM